MLLSTAAVEKHKGNFDMFKHQLKLNRVKSYVIDQQRYIHQYKSPNSSDIGSVPESCENQEPLSSNAFSASISEIIRRKQVHATEAVAPSSSIQQLSHPPSSSFHHRKQTLSHPSSIDRYMVQNPKRPAATPDESVQEANSSVRHNNKRHKSSSSSHASKRIPVQTKPNIIKKTSQGMHLLQKFVSPNLEISRITMKSNPRQPRLGIFRKGKSSALGKPIPDITEFHESMISTHKENIKPTTVMEDLSHEPPSISKFFSKRPAHTLHSSVSSHMHHAASIHQDKPKETPHTTPVLSSDHQAQKGSRSPAADAPYEAFTNNSFDSIYRLLDECQDMDQYLPPTNGHHAKPSYSPVKTPHSFFQPSVTAATTDHVNKINTNNLSFLANSKLPHPLYPSPPVHRPGTPMPVFAQSPPPPPHYSDTHSSYYDPAPRHLHHQPILMPKPTFPPTRPDQRLSLPSWQVAESVTSFAANTSAEEHARLQQEKAEDDDRTTPPNDDLELILQSQAMNMLGESIQQNEDDIQSFWLRQPSFTTRGH